jgi:hypothetical protein
MKKQTQAAAPFSAVKEFLVNFFASKKFKTFAWQTVNGFLTLAIIQIGDVDWQYAPILIAALNYTTKWINKTYLSDLGL